MSAKIADMLMGILGKRGMRFISDTTVRTGNWVRIRVLEKCEFTTLTITGSAGTMIENVPAGTEIFGDITAITLAKGSIIAYNG